MSQNSKIVCSWLNKTTRNHKGNSAPISCQDRDNTSLLARVYSSCCAPCTAKEPSIHYEKTQLRLVAEERPGGDDKVLFLILCLPFACERYLLKTFLRFDRYPRWLGILEHRNAWCYTLSSSHSSFVAKYYNAIRCQTRPLASPLKETLIDCRGKVRQ